MIKGTQNEVSWEGWRKVPATGTVVFVLVTSLVRKC